MVKKQQKEILKRVLALIDIMAPYRRGMRAKELHEQLLHKHGITSIATLYRDLDALHELGFVEKIRIPNITGDK